MRNFDRLFRNNDLEAQIGPWGDPAAFQGADYCVGNYETIGVVDTKQQWLLISVSSQPEHGHFEVELISKAAAILNGPTVAHVPGVERYYSEIVDTKEGPTVFVCDRTPPSEMVHFLLIGAIGRRKERRDVIEAAEKIAAGLNSQSYVYHAYDDKEPFNVHERIEMAV